MLKKIFLSVILVSLIAATGCVPDKFKFTKELSSSGSGRGKVLGPTDMALNKSGDIVIADSGNSRFQVLDVDGTAKVISGEAGSKGYKIRKMSGIGINPGL